MNKPIEKLLIKFEVSKLHKKHIKNDLSDNQTYWKITHKIWSVKIAKKKATLKKNFKWQTNLLKKNISEMACTH